MIGDDCIVEVIHGRVMLEKIGPNYPTSTAFYKYDLFGAPNAAPTTSSTTAGDTFPPAQEMSGIHLFSILTDCYFSRQVYIPDHGYPPFLFMRTHHSWHGDPA